MDSLAQILSPPRMEIRRNLQKLCEKFDDSYWLARDYGAIRLRVAPITQPWMLCHIAEKVLGLPKSH